MGMQHEQIREPSARVVTAIDPPRPIGTVLYCNVLWQYAAVADC